MVAFYTPGKSKEDVRNHVLSYFKGCEKVLTLPNLHFSLEKKLLEQGIKVECTERKVTIYKEQLKIAPSNIILYNKDIKHVDTSLYDGLFLDMCGPFSSSISEALHKLKDGSKIALTLLMSRESNELKKFINLNNRETSYITLLRRYNIYIEKYITYTDTVPMGVFFGVKRLKPIKL
jgi:hypothetical protein